MPSRKNDLESKLESGNNLDQNFDDVPDKKTFTGGTLLTLGAAFVSALYADRIVDSLDYIFEHAGGDLKETDIDEMYLILRYGLTENELETPVANKYRAQMKNSRMYETFYNIMRPIVRVDQYFNPYVNMGRNLFKGLFGPA